MPRMPRKAKKLNVPGAESTPSNELMAIEPMEGDDEIVQEIDVFLSPELSEQIHLMQFPLQNQAFSSPENARVRPRHCMMELDFQIPEDIGDYGSYQMSTRTYASHTIPVSTHLALGKMISKPGAEGLHLVPLSRITQMRPSFGHVDEATNAATATTDDEDFIQRESEAASSLERKPLTFQKKESERAVLARKSTYAYKKLSEESEMWIPLNVNDRESDEAKSLMEKVVCPSPEVNLLDETMQNDDSNTSLEQKYAASLNYLPSTQNGQPKEEDDTDMDGIVTKLVGLLQGGWPIPYSILKNEFSLSVSDASLFEALGSCAFLVRGNFTLNSKLLPVHPSIAHARTFILFLFQTIEVVHRARLESVYKGDNEVNPDVILMLLNQVGKKTREGWKLKLEDDTTFAAKYQDALVVNLNFWASQLRRFQPLLDLYRQ